MTTTSLVPPTFGLPTARRSAPAPTRIDPALAGDDALRERVLASLEDEESWNAERSNVVVYDGAVILQGTHGRDRQAAARVAAAVPGVRSVSDARVRDGQWMTLG